MGIGRGCTVSVPKGDIGELGRGAGGAVEASGGAGRLAGGEGKEGDVPALFSDGSGESLSSCRETKEKIPNTAKSNKEGMVSEEKREEEGAGKN
ncbi:MAG: hypothetical protein ACREQ3_10765 [Candidatus Binatia bacterium]